MGRELLNKTSSVLPSPLPGFEFVSAESLLEPRLSGVPRFLHKLSGGSTYRGGESDYG
jgi:hypothetical protein